MTDEEVSAATAALHSYIQGVDDHCAAHVLRIFLNWHRPNGVTGTGGSKGAACAECTGEYIIPWPCAYVQVMAEAFGVPA
jgi:hypothetical protein